MNNMEIVRVLFTDDIVRELRQKEVIIGQQYSNFLVESRRCRRRSYEKNGLILRTERI